MGNAPENKDFERFHRAFVLQSVLILAIMWGDADLDNLNVAGNPLHFDNALVLKIALWLVLSYFGFRYRLACAERYKKTAGPIFKTQVGHSVRVRVKDELAEPVKEKMAESDEFRASIESMNRTNSGVGPHRGRVDDIGEVKRTGILNRSIGPPEISWFTKAGHAQSHKPKDIVVSVSGLPVLSAYLKAWWITVSADPDFWEDMVPWMLGIWAWVWATSERFLQQPLS